MLSKNQRQWGYIILIVNILAAVSLLLLSMRNLAIAWALGLMFGFVIQRSRFCTVAAIRDAFLLRNFSIAKGLLLYLILTTTMFGLLYFISGQTSLTIGSKLEPVSVFTMVGALIFGIGMVIASGCASGTLIRMGEGFVMQWWSFLGIAIGLMLGNWQYDWINQYNIIWGTVFFPHFFGLLQIIFLQVGLFIILYLLFTWIEQKTYGKVRQALPLQAASEPLTIVQRIFRPWSYTVGAMFLAILTTLVFLWNQTWGVAKGITYLAAGLLNTVIPSIRDWSAFSQFDANQGMFLSQPFVFLVLAMIVGSFISTLLAQEFRIRRVTHYRFIASALVGGFFMGLGARLANGCNISSIMSGIPSLSLHGWVFLLFMILGVWVGIKILLRYLIA